MYIIQLQINWSAREEKLNILHISFHRYQRFGALVNDDDFSNVLDSFERKNFSGSHVCRMLKKLILDIGLKLWGTNYKLGLLMSRTVQ